MCSRIKVESHLELTGPRGTPQIDFRCSNWSSHDTSLSRITYDIYDTQPRIPEAGNVRQITTLLELGMMIEELLLAERLSINLI